METYASILIGSAIAFFVLIICTTIGLPIIAIIKAVLKLICKLFTIKLF